MPAFLLHERGERPLSTGSAAIRCLDFRVKPLMPEAQIRLSGQGREEFVEYDG
jgi:hypothetical protein